MAKKLFYSMGEVSEMFDVNASLIRHWESKFDVLRPRKNKKGNRMFSPGDVENLKLIYHLVKERGMTLEGANRCLKRNRGALTRDAELLERLQRVRAMLVEVREELRSDDDATILADEPDAASVGSDAFCDATAVDASAVFASAVSAADASATDTPVADASEADAVTGEECDAKSAQESEGAEVFVRFPDGGFAVDGEMADNGGADDRSTEEAGMPEVGGFAPDGEMADNGWADDRSSEEAGMPEVGGFEPEENSSDDRAMSIRLSGPEALPGGCWVAAEPAEDGNGVVDGYATECAAKPGTGVPAAESAGTEIPFTELPLSEIPAGKQPAFGQPDGGQPTGGQPDDGLSSVALSASDSPADVSGGEPAAEHSVPQPAVRRPRRKRDDEGDKELFAFYEQSLF